jgi:N-acetylglucosamine-6-phosphate deacetylase
MAIALTGARIFDGTRLIDGHAVIIDGERITAVVRERDVPAGARRHSVAGLIAPGFIDWQVNGGGGVLFNETTTADGIAAIGAAHRRYGTVAFLPTLITDTKPKMREALAATTDAIARKVPGVIGVHLEGPFLNPERKGVHDPRLMRVIEEDDIAAITGARAAGRILMTVAPEKMPAGTITRLARAGIILSAGHTAGSYETIGAARVAGLTGFTHLFNAMPPLAGREPGPVGAALNDAEAWCGLIVDMQHVSAASLKVAIAARGWQRMTLVTDAMPTVGSAESEFTLLGRTVRRRDGALKTDDGTLAGSDLDMASAVRNTVSALGLPLEAALHMASRAPAEFLGLGGELGRIATGYRASLVLLDDTLAVRETWIDGAAAADQMTGADA